LCWFLALRDRTALRLLNLDAAMVHITVGFQPHSFERATIELIMNDVRARLAGHEFGRLRIALFKDFRREIVMHFHGDEQEVAKARRILGAY
jgi:hypothetical protein